MPIYKQSGNKLSSAKKFFKARIDQIGDWCVGDIRRCCRLKKDGTYEPNGALVGAFILWVCALDYLGGLLTNEHKDYKLRIKTFLEEYINQSRKDSKKYNFQDILDLRNGLVHSYCPNLLLVSSIDRRLHLGKTGERTFLVLEEIVEDTERAFLKFKKDLLSSDEMMLTAFDYYSEYPPVGPIQIKIEVKKQD